MVTTLDHMAATTPFLVGGNLRAKAMNQTKVEASVITVLFDSICSSHLGLLYLGIIIKINLSSPARSNFFRLTIGWMFMFNNMPTEIAPNSQASAVV